MSCVILQPEFYCLGNSLHVFKPLVRYQLCTLGIQFAVFFTLTVLFIVHMIDESSYLSAALSIAVMMAIILGISVVKDDMELLSAFYLHHIVQTLRDKNIITQTDYERIFKPEE